MAALFPVLLTIQIVVCVAMIGVILLQRSEGGGLGLGSGGGVGGLMSGRGAANALSRTTAILAAIFIGTSIALALVAKATRSNSPLAPAVSSDPMTTLPGAPSPTPAPAPAPGGQPAAPAPAAPPAIPVPAAPQPSGGQPAPATPQ
jgi:preprotein translocase subunit SecG